MDASYLDAYRAIKALEANGSLLPLPTPVATVVVGDIDAQSREFTWAVPTFTQTIQPPPPPAPPPGLPGGGGGPTKPSQPIVLTVGLVTTAAVRLLLGFDVTNVPVVAESARVAPGVGLGGSIGIGGTGGVTVTGFPSLASQGSRILPDASMSASSMEQTVFVTPPVSIFALQITAGGQSAFIHIAIIRPPVLGAGGFTIPALPVEIIYAPPQGAQKKNGNVFNDKASYTRSMTTSVSSNTATKTTQAYTAADIAGKLADLAGAVAGVAAGWPAIAAAAGLSATEAVVGATNKGSSGGGSGSGSGSSDKLTVDGALKTASAAAKAVGDILTGIGTQTVQSDNATVSTETDGSWSLTLTSSDTYGSAAGEGPGAGDRFVLMTNVRAVWSNLNGDVGLTILGFEGVEAYSGAALLQDQQALSQGGTATLTSLDAQTISLLIALDPYLAPRPRHVVILGPPVIRPPRFTPLSPARRTGVGTSSGGDVFSIANEQITDTRSVTTNASVNVTDAKPGWIDVIFGADNTETTTTVTIANGMTKDEKSDETITNSVTMLSQGNDDPYDIMMYYDQLFGTLMPVPANSPLLQGISIVGNYPDQSVAPST
jgi:hypothetical protein